MKYYSTNNHKHQVGLSEAVIKGLATDNGLYMPERIPVLPNDLIEKNVRNELSGNRLCGDRGFVFRGFE